jgi:hypothetical protein
LEGDPFLQTTFLHFLLFTRHLLKVLATFSKVH